MLINMNNVYFNFFETLKIWTFVLILKKSMVITLEIVNITCLILGLIVILYACGWFIIRETLTNTFKALVQKLFLEIFYRKMINN